MASTKYKMRNGERKVWPNIKKVQAAASTGNEILLTVQWVINQLAHVVITLSLPASRLSNCDYHLSCIQKEHKMDNWDQG